MRSRRDHIRVGSGPGWIRSLPRLAVGLAIISSGAAFISCREGCHGICRELPSAAVTTATKRAMITNNRTCRGREVVTPPPIAALGARRWQAVACHGRPWHDQIHCHG